MSENKRCAVALTFNEVIELHKIVQEKIKDKDYGFAPVMNIIFDTPDEEFEEYQEVRVCCIHDMTKEIQNAKAENRKPDFEKVYKDITDEAKADFI